MNGAHIPNNGGRTPCDNVAERRGGDRRASDYERTLTDADVNAIVERFQEVVTKQFYTDIGKGVIAACKRALIVILIGLAAYGSWKGIK